jgi:hypothetical protein
MLRVILGLGVIVVGILFLQGMAGFLVAVIGLIPLCTALSGVCFFRYTFEGYRKTGSEHQVLPDHDCGRHLDIRPVLLE